MESELQEQIAGAGSDPQYLAANEIGLDPLEESDQVEISLSKPLVSGLMTSTAQNVENQDEGQYLENTTEYRMSIGGLFTTTKLFSDDGSINAAKLAQGSEMIDGENDGVQDLLEQILDAAGLSEIPEGMSEAEYQELVAQAILEWLLQNWQYIEDGNYDEWQNVMESLGLSGDCEDFAILLASLLIAAGIDPENVAVVISADGTHAFVAVEIDGKVYILDNNGEFVETEYASLNELLADEEMAGAWFKQGGAYGINNEDLNINTADGSQGTGGNEWIDAFNEADAGMEEMYDGWNEDDMIDENSHGDFNTLNEEAVKSFTEMALERLTRLLMLAMAANMDSDVRDVIEEILTDMPLEEEDKSTLRGSILKLFSAKMKTMQQAFSKLLERVNKHNEKVMNDKIEDAKEMLILSKRASLEGKGVALMNGKFIGPPMVRAAEKILEKYQKLGVVVIMLLCRLMLFANLSGKKNKKL